MSVVVLAGERYAAGLDWMDRRGNAETARRAREYDRPFVVHWRSQTGYGPGEPESADGMPSLAAALSAHLDAASFVALVEGQGGRFALHGGDGAVGLGREQGEAGDAQAAPQAGQGRIGRHLQQRQPHGFHLPGPTPGAGDIGQVGGIGRF